MSRHIKAIPTATEYFAAGTETPTIAHEFRRGNGWVRQIHRKKVSAAWLRKLRDEGVTHVALKFDGRLADFSIEELLASARKGH